MSWLGNQQLGDTFYFLFTTRRFSTGAPYTLAGTPVLSVYEENNLVQIAGAHVEITVDYDGVTGLNEATIIATTGNGYEVGKTYSVVITTGTVDSVSVVGEVVGRFRIVPAEASAGVPDVNVASIDDIDFAATMKTSLNTACDTVTVTSMGANVLTAAAINADAITEAKIADDAIAAEHLATGALSADAFAADAIVAATLATGALTADAFAADAIVAATLATNAITTDALADGTITAAKLGPDCITEAKIADNAIAAEHLAADAITEAKIADNAIAAEHIAAAAIDAATFASDVTLADQGEIRLTVEKGADANVICFPTLRDTTGELVTGKVFGNATCYWIRDGDAGETSASVTVGTLGTHGNSETDATFILVDDTNMPGKYQLTIPDDCCETGADRCDVRLLVTGCNPVDIHIELRDGITVSATGEVSLLAATQTSIDNIEADTNELQTDDYPTSIAAIQTTVDAIETEVGTAGAGLTDLGGMSTGMKAEVNAECDTSIETYRLDHLVAVADADDVVDDSIIAKLAATAGDWSTFVDTTDSLQSIRDHVGDGTNLTEAGGTGDQFSAIPWNASWDAEVQSECSDALDASISELGVAAPSATPSLRNAVMLMYMMTRNQFITQTSGTDAIQVYNDADTMICKKLITDAAGDYTEDQMTSG